MYHRFWSGCYVSQKTCFGEQWAGLAVYSGGLPDAPAALVMGKNFWYLLNRSLGCRWIRYGR